MRRRRRGSISSAGSGKTRITIRIDDDVLTWFRQEARARGYQPLLNRALREYISREPLEATLRRVLREELARARAEGRPSPHAYGYEQPRPALVADADDADAQYGSKPRRPSRRRPIKAGKR